MPACCITVGPQEGQLRPCTVRVEILQLLTVAQWLVLGGFSFKTDHRQACHLPGTKHEYSDVGRPATHSILSKYGISTRTH